SHGTLAVVGGQAGMEGAALLAARTALLSGSGKVFLGWTQNAEALRVDPLHPELMLRPVEALLRQHATLGINSWAIGCGMGMTQQAQDWLTRLLAQTARHALVLDADALNLIAQANGVPQALLDRAQPAVLTPHPLEAARLLGCSVKTVQADRVGSALELARRFHAVVVLKGAGTVLANPQAHWAINTSGNPGLASAGTGDVLSGLIGSLAAQGLEPWDAARAGVWLHGAAADHCVARGVGPIGLRATELQTAIRLLLNQPHS
ncbi:MAG: NAD(P)H-hydrate dehydratase, partial [Pigmentiphaga sp.]